MRSKKTVLLSFVLVTLLALTASVPALYAQDNSVTITLTMPSFLLNSLPDDTLSTFEADNPGIKVKTVDTGNNISFPSPANGLDAHLKAVHDYVSAADVVFLNSNSLSEEATRVGYFLDLTPLASADTTLNTDDYPAEIWQSFQWDNGIWALPVSADVVMMVYDKAAFDSANLAYPDGNWTMDDLANAATTLAVKDSNGTVTTPGLQVGGNNLGLLFRSLLGSGFYDGGSVPNNPAFSTNTDLQTMMTTWSDLVNQGVVSTQGGGFGGNDTIPMRISASNGFTARGQNAVQPGVALLPGGKAGLNVQGFAVSSGTPYPEQAYALAKYLTTRADMANNFLSAIPARTSLVGVQTTNQGGGPGGGGPGGGGGFAFRRNSADVKAAVDLGLANALPTSELRYSQYVTQAVDKMKSENIDASAALQETEAAAQTNVQTADSQKGTNAVIVATAVPDVVLQPGQVKLTFGMLSLVDPLPNRDKWDGLIQQFVASDPQVRQIDMDTSLRAPDEFATKTDCFYLPLNYVPQVDMTTVLSLDPFLDADTTFDRNDVIGTIMSQVQRDNKTWALPIDLQPEGLNYNSTQFTKFGVPAPQAGWTIDAFSDALKTLKPTPDDQPPFVSQSPGDTYLLMLMAAYGGLPLDFRTTPPTINYTDQNTVNAIRQVLDLAKNGYIKYNQLAGGGNFIITRGAQDTPPEIYTLSLSGFTFRIQLGGPQGQQTSTQSDYKVTTYPKGSQYTAATYNIGTAYISATTQNADACYRWLNTVARHPELFSAMPVRHSLVSDPTIASTWTPDEKDFYTAFEQSLGDPNTLVFPSIFAGALRGNFLLQRWLDQAFDNYVLKDGDLETDLATAETYGKAFNDCIAALPPYDPTAQTQRQYFQQYAQCAQKVDPNAGSLFGGG